MKILMIAAECYPFVKVGGVADVVNSLPPSLAKNGVDIDVVIPYYSNVSQYFEKEGAVTKKTIATARVMYNAELYSVDIIASVIPDTNINIYFISEPNLVSNGGVYYDEESMSNEQDVIDRFAFFTKSVFEIFINKKITDKDYDVIHAHDWHTGMIVQLNEIHDRNNEDFRKPKTVFTIHNLGYQGFSKLEVLQKLEIDINSDKSIEWDAQDGNILFILQALVGADYITTVSDTYSKEIQTEQYGEGLHEILETRKDRLIGIINGISYDIFSPTKDKNIYLNYSEDNYQSGKLENKKQLIKELAPKLQLDRPMIGIVTRFAHQKGVDLVAEAANEITELGFSLIILGTGDKNLEEKVRKIGNNNDNVSANIMYSNEIAMKIYAASDYFLIPSRYEPSGLTQMIAMKYGSIPIARKTGGLADTIRHDHNGYLFNEMHKEELIELLEKVMKDYQNEKTFEDMIHNALNSNFDWDNSAKKYITMYKKCIETD